MLSNQFMRQVISVQSTQKKLEDLDKRIRAHVYASRTDTWQDFFEHAPTSVNPCEMEANLLYRRAAVSRLLLRHTQLQDIRQSTLQHDIQTSSLGNSK